MKKLELPKPNAFVPVNSAQLGELCEVLDKGPECRDTYQKGDKIVVLGGQIYSVPELTLEWVHDSAVLMIVKE